MSIEGDIVEELEVDIDQPSNPTNPITDPKSQISDEPEVKEDKPAPHQELPKGVQRRIDRAVRQRYEAEARSKMLEERLSHLEQQSRPAPRQPDDTEPTLDKFDNFDQYVAAKAEYIARKQIETTLTEREQRQQAAYEQAARQQTADDWGKRLAQATVEMPDFEDVISSSDVPMTEPMQRVIMEADDGPRLAYYLAQHPDEAFQISNMSPIRAIAALGRIEERLSSQPQQKTVTRAPAPVKSIGNKASARKSPAEMSDTEYAKWRKSGKAA